MVAFLYTPRNYCYVVVILWTTGLIWVFVNDQKQMVFSYNNSITVSNSQLPVMSVGSL